MDRRYLRWIAGLAIAAGAIAWIWVAPQPPLMVRVATVERATVEKTVANTRAGTVTACRRALLSPGIGGQIAALPVAAGDRVEQGDLLLELWNHDLRSEAELTELEGDAVAASARATCLRADNARREATRIRGLGHNIISADRVDQTQTDADVAAAECSAAHSKAKVQMAHLQVALAQLAKTRLIAPFAGVVAEVNGEINEYATPSPPGIPTPPAIDLIDNTCFYVQAPIDEVDVAGIQVDQAARISLDAFPKQQFPGRVRRIANYVLDREKQARTVEVEVEFTRATDLARLLAGYSADVEIILATHTDTLRVPTEAILDEDQVYLLHDGRLHKRQVQTGLSNWRHSEIIAGLTAGDQVVTSLDTEGLADGIAAQASTGQ